MESAARGPVLSRAPWAAARRLLIAGATALYALSVGLAASASDAGDSTLSFVAEEGGRFEWRLFDAQRGTTTAFLSLDAEPEAVFFDGGEPVVYFASKGEVRRASLRVPGTSTRVAARPEAAGARLDALWLEQSTGRLRALLVTELDEGAVAREVGGVSYRLPDGTRVAVGEELPWGEPVVCSVLEVAANGVWATLERRGVRGGAPDAPGCAAVADLRHERGRSLGALLESYRCGPEACHVAPGGAVPAEVTQAVLATAGAQEVRSLGELSTAGLFFGAGLGDTWHALPPLFFVRAGMPPKRLDLSLEGQLQLARRGDRVLVAEEFSGASPRIVDLGSGEIVFSAAGRDAVWLPQ